VTKKYTFDWRGWRLREPLIAIDPGRPTGVKVRQAVPDMPPVKAMSWEARRANYFACPGGKRDHDDPRSISYGLTPAQIRRLRHKLGHARQSAKKRKIHFGTEMHERIEQHYARTGNASPGA
jgi:hypothetical protein